MTSREFGRCVSERELPRFLLALLFAIPLALIVIALAFLSNGLLVAIVLFLAFLIWFSFEIFYALLIANWILVSEDNYPRLNALLEEVKATVGVRKRIDMIVYQQGEFNASFNLLFSRRAIFVNSDLLAEGVSDDELRWLIGRFVGRIRAKERVGWLRYAISAAETLLVFNLFIYPYQRATAYTGDRVGLAAVKGDISAAVSCMNKLMVGREIGFTVNPAGIARQYRRVKGSLFGFLARLSSPLPHMMPRYVDLIRFSERAYPEQYEAFAGMNPSFQIAGGALPLVRSARKWGDGVSNVIGWSLIGGSAAATVAAAFLLITLGPGFGIFGRSFLGSASASSFYGPGNQAVNDDYAIPIPPPAAADEADINAYAAAEQAGSVPAYRRYLAAYPGGVHASDAEAAIDQLKQQVIGRWSFSTQGYRCDAGPCVTMQGQMEVAASADDGYTCRLHAVETDGAKVLSEALETCAIVEADDGALAVNSTVSQATSTTYQADNFTLRRSGAGLSGALLSTINVAVDFTRYQEPAAPPAQ